MSLNLLPGVSSAPANSSVNTHRDDKPADQAAEGNEAPAPFAQVLHRARQAAPRKAEAKDAKTSTKPQGPAPREAQGKAKAGEDDTGQDAASVSTATRPLADGAPASSALSAPATPDTIPVAPTTTPPPTTADALLQAALAASAGLASAREAATPQAEAEHEATSQADDVMQALVPGAAPRAGDTAAGRAKAALTAQTQTLAGAQQGARAPGEGEDLKALWQAQLGREAAPAAQAPGASTPQAAASAAAQVAQASTASTAPAFEPMAQAPINPLVGHPEFAPALGSQLTTFVREGIRQAELTLNPAEMGPVTVNIALDGQQAQVDFIAAHAATRVALEQSLPALASALHQAGFTLSGGGVSDQRPRGQRSANQEGARADRDRLETVGSSGARTGAEARRGQGLLDMFA